MGCHLQFYLAVLLGSILCRMKNHLLQNLSSSQYLLKLTIISNWLHNTKFQMDIKNSLETFK